MSLNRSINKLQDIHNIKHYSAMKRNEMLIDICNKMNESQKNMLSERNHTHTTTFVHYIQGQRSDHTHLRAGGRKRRLNAQGNKRTFFLFLFIGDPVTDVPISAPAFTHLHLSPHLHFLLLITTLLSVSMGYAYMSFA